MFYAHDHAGVRERRLVDGRLARVGTGLRPVQVCVGTAALGRPSRAQLGLCKQPQGIQVLGEHAAECLFRRKTLRRLFSYGLYLPIQWQPNKESGSLTNFARERECPPVLVHHH